MRILRKGMKGDDVRQWQEFLNGQGLGVGTADGQFGNRTFQATVQFQRRHGLGSDGVVGNNTLSKAKELGFDEGGGSGAAPPPVGATPSAPSSSPPANTPASIGPFNEQALAQIMPNLKADKRALYYPFLVAAMVEFDITTPLRIAAFVAQLAHESAEFRFMEEIWGPTAAQKRYEGRKDLGNTQPGDGFRFKGRGPIQITGRANYTKYGKLLGIDLVDNPALAATPEVGFRTAGLYWKMNNCNALADQQKFIAITKAINGGTNGLEDRQKYYERAKRVLGIATRGLPSDETRGADEQVERSFTRGLDEPGETTPTAADRNAEESAAASGGSAAGLASPSPTKKPATKKAAAKKSAPQRTAGSEGAAKKGGAKKAAKKATPARKAAKKSPAGRGATWSGAKKTTKSAAKKSAPTRAASGAKKAAKKAAGGSRKAAASKTTSRAAAGAGKKGAGKSAARKGGAKKAAKGGRR
ncbi:MAG TPA: peptidoglycan-binding protein [Pyrinomonadaceae bacterium]|nr:peptidoglycan-binding protein [Pyrinomonadaceae bacterium]